jgi:hypothetical protein
VIVDETMYRDVTGDTFTDQTKVLRMLARAQARAEEVTERKFDKVERTETLTIEADGLSWPSAYPVVSVSIPSTAVISDDAISIRTGQATWASALAALYVVSPVIAAAASVLVTYVGGWDAPVAGVGTAPTGLTDAICELAHRYCEPANTTTVPAGATSAGNRGQSVSGGRLGGSSSIPGPLRATLRGYLHAHARLP